MLLQNIFYPSNQCNFKIPSCQFFLDTSYLEFLVLFSQFFWKCHKSPPSGILYLDMESRWTPDDCGLINIVCDRFLTILRHFGGTKTKRPTVGATNTMKWGPSFSPMDLRSRYFSMAFVTVQRNGIILIRVPSLNAFAWGNVHPSVYLTRVKSLMKRYFSTTNDWGKIWLMNDNITPFG